MNIAGLPPVESAGIIAGMIDLILLISAGFTIGAALLGLAAIYQSFGMAALWAAVGLLYLVYLGLERRRGAAYFDPGGVFGGGGPALPAPGKQALPAAPQIGRSRQQPVPGPKK